MPDLDDLAHIANDAEAGAVLRQVFEEPFALVEQKLPVVGVPRPHGRAGFAEVAREQEVGPAVAIQIAGQYSEDGGGLGHSGQFVYFPARCAPVFQPYASALLGLEHLGAGQLLRREDVLDAGIGIVGVAAEFFEGIGKFAIIFFPWDLSVDWGLVQLTSAHSYALLIIAVTTLYTIKGGMYSVVGTEVLQFVIMTISCFVVGYICYTSVTQEQILSAVPPGWTELFFGWEMDLDWTGYLDSVNKRIAEDGFGAIGLLLIAMVFKGIFASLAGPVPSYDMQRILSTPTPSDAAKMSGLTILVLYFPRYLMIAGFAILSLVYLRPQFEGMGADIDFETVLPMAIDRFIPSGFQGLLLAGLLAAFMGTFAAFINAAPAYLVNDLYKKYINPNASNKTYIRYSYLASFGLVAIGLIGGFYAQSINSLTLWITSALYGGYAAANALKWIWWRFNGYGYFWGMIGGLLGATFLPPLFPDVIAIYLFPIILALSLAGCFIGTYLRPAEQEAVLKHFYKETKPWGFWKPIREKVMAEDPDFQPNRSFGRDSFNILVGIVWQMSLTVMPIYLLIKQSTHLTVTFLIFLVTTWLLKRYWWDGLED